MNLVSSQQFVFSPTWLGSFVFDASGLHLTASRNANLGFALAFPFSSTSSTISGLETFGDNQFITADHRVPGLAQPGEIPIPLRCQRIPTADMPRVLVSTSFTSRSSAARSPPPPKLSSRSPKIRLFISPIPHSSQQTSLPNSAFTPAGDGSFSQNVQRLGLYAEDSWRVTPRLTVNYGLRYDTTFGLFDASGRSQAQNPYPAFPGSGGRLRSSVLRRTTTAKPLLRASESPTHSARPATPCSAAASACTTTTSRKMDGSPRSRPSTTPTSPTAGGIAPPSIIDPNYHTPYAIHATAGIQHAFNANWSLSADWTLETGMHGYRRYDFPNVSVFRTDNRSSYNALALHLQGNVARRLKPRRQLHPLLRKNLGLRPGRALRLRQRRLRSRSTPSPPATTARPVKTSATAPFSPAPSTLPQASSSPSCPKPKAPAPSL